MSIGFDFREAVPLRRPMRCQRLLLPMVPFGTRWLLQIAAFTWRVVPFRFSRAPWFWFRGARGFEPAALLRELYSLTTSPSGRARPLGEVVKEYNSLKRAAGSKPRAPRNQNQGARLKRKGTTRQVKAAICNSHRVPKGTMGSKSRWQRIGLRNGTASRKSNPIDTF